MICGNVGVLFTEKILLFYHSKMAFINEHSKH